MHQMSKAMIAMGPPPLVITLVFIGAYLAVGIPAHFLLGPGARDYLGTIAGVFVSLAYLTLILGF
ncbi:MULTISPECIES: hypothetical protein [unclassified Paraburkholderia]|uniref:hypothetical protein n=1 Tax=unclassified Paraburkholderia TaxID=2615204 RepID=UPI002AB286DC|nr:MULTISPECIES: hypothetical protein [unclassified Paraburkholderia]